MGPEFSRPADILIGALLSGCMVLGIPGNMVSLYHFTTTPTKNKNATFFKHVYTVISFFNLLLCVSLFPVIDSAFANGRISTVLTSSSALCGIWTVVYAVLLDMSVFMVAMISVSRIVLLIAPTTNFNVKLSWLIPIFYSILTLALKVIYNILKVSTNSFVPPLMACVFIASDGTVSEGGEPTVHLPNELILTITDTIQTGFTVLPISICSALSLWLLRRSRNMTQQIGGCKKAQDEASKTVIIFTVMYVVCNIPIFIYLIYFWVWNLSIDRSRVYVTQSQFMMSYLEMYSSVFMNSYSSVLVSRVFPAINSTLNPLIYYWRFSEENHACSCWEGE